MLIQFNFKNFKSFREEATLDLSAAKVTEFSDRVVTVGSEKILPVAAIYGANASGKSRQRTKQGIYRNCVKYYPGWQDRPPATSTSTNCRVSILP